LLQCPGCRRHLSNEPSVDNDSVVIAAAQLDDILASQASAASGLTAIDWDRDRLCVRPAEHRRGDPQDFDASFFDPTTYIGAVNPDGSDPWWAGWTLDFGCGWCAAAGGRVPHGYGRSR
jgi:hypothetical protein